MQYSAQEAKNDNIMQHSAQEAKMIVIKEIISLSAWRLFLSVCHLINLGAKNLKQIIASFILLIEDCVQ